MSTKYKCSILLPLTAKNTKINPVSYPLMVFPNEPNISEGERKTLGFQEEGEECIYFDALFVRRYESLEANTRIVSYIFEIEDRDLSLQIAQMVKKKNPDIFEEDNFIT